MSLFTAENRSSQLTTRGITLVEMLISMAVTLLMMAAVVNLFANIGAGVRNRRASMELGSQLRLARARLFKDLTGATSAARPKLPSDDHDDGYLEIVEGEFSDKNPTNIALTDVTIVPSTQISNIDGGGLGDFDDILALTVRSESEPFVGIMPVWKDPDGGGPEPVQWVPTTIESNLAEIIWYAVENPASGANGEPGMRTVYRRVLLIAPWVSELPRYAGDTPAAKNIPQDKVYYQVSDVSFRREGDLRVANTLSDLTKRENRFAHHVNGATSLPHVVDVSAIRVIAPDTQFPTSSTSILHPHGLPFEWDPSDPVPANPTVPPENDRQGEDVMLNDALAFDIRVYDPGAPLFQTVSGQVVEPSDVGWRNAPSANLVGIGAFVDLLWNPSGVGASKTWTHPADAPVPLFEGVPSPKSGLNFSTFGPPNYRSVTYDTWPYHYEDDGIDQDNDGLVDEGTDGLDNDNANGVDDSLERETAPPYDTPLRGVQVKIRVYERDTRQIREATVTRNFVPQ